MGYFFKANLQRNFKAPTNRTKEFSIHPWDGQDITPEVMAPPKQPPLQVYASGYKKYQCTGFAIRLKFVQKPAGKLYRSSDDVSVSSPFSGE